MKETSQMASSTSAIAAAEYDWELQASSGLN
jgi:hypothetical protein